jgi:hypothetical protein
MQVPPSLIRRLREGQAGFMERRGMDNRELALYTAEEVFAQAERGNVVLRGWGATCLLRPVQHVVRVRVTRPLPLRVDWLMERWAPTTASRPRPRCGAATPRMPPA